MTSMSTLRARGARLFSLALLLCAGLCWSALASAQHTSGICPQQSATVANGGSVQIDLNACHTNFLFPPFGLGPVNVTLPQHGTAILGELFTAPSTYDAFVTYTHNGNAATSDFFEFEDENGDVIRVVMTIDPPTSAIVVSPATITLQTGVAFNQALDSTGGVAPYVYSLDSGALPAGLSLSAAGVLEGTPTQRAPFGFTVRSQDSLGDFALKTYGGTILDPVMTASPTSTTLTQGVASTLQYAGGGGTAPYSFSISSGSPPTGTTLQANGQLTGTPSATGTFNFVLVVDDSTTDPTCPGCNFFTLVPVQVEVTTAPSVSIAVAPAAVDEDGTDSLVYTVTRNASLASETVVNLATTGTATSGVDYTGAVATVTIPAGATTATVTIDPIADTEVEPDETVILTIQAGAGYTVGAPASATGTILNDDVPSASITVAPAAVAEDGVDSLVYTVTLDQAAFSATSVGFTVGGTATSGSDFTVGGSPLVIPAGNLSGTITVDPIADAIPEPDETVVITLVAGAGYSVGAPASATGTILNDDVTITVSPGTLPGGTVAAAYSQTFTASGGTGPYTFAVTAGGLPAGLTLAPDGTLSGTPSGGGSFDFTVTATDSSPFPGPFPGSQAYTLVVAAPTLALPPDTLPDGILGQAYSGNAGPASGGTAPYVYSVSAGSLPPGLTLDGGTGALSGTPSALGIFNFGITATDSSTGTGPYTVAGSYQVVIVDLPPVAGAVSLTVPYGAGATPVTLDLSGGTAVSVAVATAPANGTAVASGTSITYQPAAGYAGPDSFTYTATNSGGTSAPAAVTVTVQDPVLAVTAGGPLTGTVAAPYSNTFSFSGGAAPWSGFQVDNLPAGVAITGTTGTSVTISGTPTQAGSFALAVSATDGSSGSGPFTLSQTFNLDVAAPPLTLDPAPGTLAADYATSYSQAFSAGGGTGPYSYALTGALPAGMSFSGDTLSGTPTSTGSFGFSITATDTGSSGAGAPFTITQAYTLDVAAPTIVLDPATLPNGTAGQAYAANLSATGAVAPYSFAVTTGALPPGMTLAADGTLSGTPTSSGSFGFSVTATDANGQTGSRAYAVDIAVPVLVITPASLPSGVVGAGYSQSVSASGGVAPYGFAVTAGALPDGLSLAAGGAISGTPTTAGDFDFTVTATDSTGGTAASASQAYSVTIVFAPPVAVDDTATVLAGETVSIAVTANDVSAAPITGIAIATPPAQGTATVSGLEILYTADTLSPATVSFTYTASGPGGTSAPGTVTVTVNPLPIPADFNVSTTPATPVSVTLTAGATGGPFTGADIVSVSPASAGTSVITASGADYVLTFTPDTQFSGAVVVRFTLDNAFATSAPGTVNITVEARPDPSQDAEVRGLHDAQVESTRRFATAQIGNFQQRLQRLHRGGGGSDGVDNQLGFSVRPRCIESVVREWMDPCSEQWGEAGGASAPGEAATRQARPGENRDSPFNAWVAGTIRSGSQDGRNGRADVSFETDGASAGMDYRVSPSLALGGGIGYGRDDNEVGRNGSRAKGDATTLAVYASYHPGERFYVDSVLGYQRLSFDLRRYVEPTTGFVSGRRDGDQWFASVSTGADLLRGQVNFNPYLRLDLARATLDGYTETGDAIYALRYGKVDVDTSTGNLGLRVESAHPTGWGVFSPQFRVEYQRDFNGSASGTVQYADLVGAPLLALPGQPYDRSRWMLGAGARFDLDSDWSFGLEYRGQVGSSGERDNGLLLNIQKSY